MHAKISVYFVAFIQTQCLFPIQVRGTKSRPGLGEGMDRDDDLTSPFGKPPPSLWPEAPAGIGDADSQPICAMY